MHLDHSILTSVFEDCPPPKNSGWKILVDNSVADPGFPEGGGGAPRSDAAMFWKISM